MIGKMIAAGLTALISTVDTVMAKEQIAAWDVLVEADNANDALAIKGWRRRLYHPLGCDRAYERSEVVTEQLEKLLTSFAAPTGRANK
jgi:hypothetical protein